MKRVLETEKVTVIIIKEVILEAVDLVEDQIEDEVGVEEDVVGLTIGTEISSEVVVVMEAAEVLMTDIEEEVTEE